MDSLDDSTFWRLVVLYANLMLSFFAYALPFILLAWLVSHLKPHSKVLATELGREGETRSWDRERRRRFGRHQHRHGHHHRDR